MKPFDKHELLRQFDDAFAAVAAEQTGPVPRYKPLNKPERKVFPFLYLPVEVKAREFESKALIARDAKALGFTVILGASWVLSAWISHLPPGIALLKSANAIDAANLMNWVRAGTMTAVLDEEMFGVTATPSYLSATVHPYVPMFADMICAQGPSYADVFPYPVRPVVTGNPRVLTYRQQQHGNDILVCLQSGNINNNGPSMPEALRATLKLAPSPLSTDQGKAWAQILRDSLIHECDLLPLVMDTIAALAIAFPDRRIVVRPHPVEKLSAWHFPQPNVTVDATGSIIDAMKQSAVLVFVSGCSTGVDAYLAKMPAVRLGAGGHGVSASMHTEANTPQEAVAAVRQAALWNGDLTHHFAPLNLMPQLARLFTENRATGQANITHTATIKVKDFHRRKFPDTSETEVSDLVGSKATQVSWNTWEI